MILLFYMLSDFRQEFSSGSPCSSRFCSSNCSVSYLDIFGFIVCQSLDSHFAYCTCLSWIDSVVLSFQNCVYVATVFGIIVECS